MISRPSTFIAAAFVVAIVLLGHLDIRAGLFNEQLLTPTRIQGKVFPKILTDPIGENFVLAKPPQRIVSVTLGTDEMLSALVKTDRIVGVTHLVDDDGISNIPTWYPGSITRIHGEVEEILALEPDLVFIAAYTRAETVRLLLGAGIPVVRLSRYSTFKDIENNIQTVADVTGSEVKAREMITGLKNRAQKARNRVASLPRPRVLYYTLNGYTAGVGTRIDEMIEIAGGDNVLRETGITGAHKISEEMAIGLEPDVILLSASMPDDEVTPVEQLRSRPAWQNVPAVVNKQVHHLQGAWVLSVSQFSWQGIDKMAALLHPEVFTQ